MLSNKDISQHHLSLTRNAIPRINEEIERDFSFTQDTSVGNVS